MQVSVSTGVNCQWVKSHFLRLELILISKVLHSKDRKQRIIRRRQSKNIISKNFYEEFKILWIGSPISVDFSHCFLFLVLQCYDVLFQCEAQTFIWPTSMASDVVEALG